MGWADGIIYCCLVSFAARCSPPLHHPPLALPLHPPLHHPLLALPLHPPLALALRPPLALPPIYLPCPQRRMLFHPLREQLPGACSRPREHVCDRRWSLAKSQESSRAYLVLASFFWKALDGFMSRAVQQFRSLFLMPIAKSKSSAWSAPLNILLGCSYSVTVSGLMPACQLRLTGYGSELDLLRVLVWDFS